MKLKINKEKIDKLSPEDAIPLFVKISRLIFGKKKPDGFTRIVFSLNLFSWFLLFMWNMVCYFVLISSDIIKENKGFSVNAIIRRNGQKLGFNGQDFLDAITQFYFLNNFIWMIIFIGLIFMYRKKAFYPFIVLGALGVHFSLMFFTLGLQYFIEDVSFFDKILYAVLIGLTIIHSFLMKKEIHDKEIEEQELQY
jgi:preprotein translocase subunit SecG